MSGVLIIAEQRRGELRPVSLELIGAAQSLRGSSGEVAVAVLGPTPERFTGALALQGVDEILSSFEQAGITMFLLQSLPHCQPGEYERWLRDRGLEPFDTQDRIEELRNTQGIGYCNITKCCTKVCPESIEITDNGIIPLKERVVDKFYDPLGWFWRSLKRKSDSETVNRES
jgi:hypothetical protein